MQISCESFWKKNIIQRFLQTRTDLYQQQCS